MPQSFNYKPPVTQGINRLADTIGVMLDARNQRLASEQKAQMDAIKEGYDTFEKTVNVLKIPNLPNNIYESAVDLHNQKAVALKKFGVNINPLPKGVDYNNDDAHKTVVKQLQALPKALESGAMSFTQMPEALNTITQDYWSGANDKKRASVEKMIKDIQKDESGKQFSTFANVMADPSSMGKTPEEQNSIALQMVANLRVGDREAATDLWKMWQDKQRSSSGLPYKVGQIVKDIFQGGKLYQGTFAGMNPDNTPRFVNMQEQKESFKAKNIIGRGGLSKRPIMQDSNTGNLIYGDSFDKGIKEPVPSEDSSAIRPTTVRGLEATQVSDLAGMKNTFDRISTIERKLSDPKMINRAGPIMGRWEKLKLKFVEDGASQSVLNELRSLITIAYQLSGKQISVQEMKLLEEAMLPRLEQPGENLLSTLAFAKSWIKNMHNDRLKYFTDAFYDTNIQPLSEPQLSTQPSSTGRKPGQY